MSLAGHLARRIAAEGPMTLADYMSACLLHPDWGYYTRRDPLGSAGDFITAPETSQMFGELIGLCLAQSWLDQGAPTPFALVELGPGRGTLMADILRATRGVPGFHAAARVVLVEASPVLRARQALALPDAAPEWVDDVEALPDLPVFCVANEFFDALPVRQFRRDGRGWRETVVGLRDGALSLGLTDPAPLAALSHRLADTGDGMVVETSAAAISVAATLGARVEARGGAVLIVDYGDWRSQGDTFQALRAHRPVGVLEDPGACDLTAHVDFEALARAAPAAHTKMTPQGIFLERLGITPRAQALAAGLSGANLDQHVAAHRRLTHPEEMGTLFKVMALYPHKASPPPGLETANHLE